MSQRMDLNSNARCLQIILIFTLLNICICWPQNEHEIKNSSSDEDSVAVESVSIEPNNCSWPAIWYPQSNWCERLLAEGPCGDNQWLVLGDNDVPQCQARDCPDKQIKYKGQCIGIGSTNQCSLGMHVVALETGQGYCDCQNEHVYWVNEAREDQEARCYALYRRGPCPNKQLLYMSNVDGKARCRVTRCQEGEVDIKYRNGSLSLAWFGRTRGRCTQLGSQGPCEGNLKVGIDNKTMQLACVKSGLMLSRTLINAPTLDCGPGSRRDTLGKCRRSLF